MPGRVEALRLGGAHGHGGGVLGHPRQLHPHRVVGDLAHHAAGLEGVGHPVRQHLGVGGAHQARPRLHHLARVRGTAHAGHPRRPKASSSAIVGGVPSGRHEALGERDDPRALGHAQVEELAHRLGDRLGGHAQRRRGRPGRRSSCSAPSACTRRSRGSSTPGQVALVVARARELLRPARGCGVSSVVRRPARSSRSATAVPKEPAPTTVTRRACWPGERMAARYLAPAARAKPAGENAGSLLRWPDAGTQIALALAGASALAAPFGQRGGARRGRGRTFRSAAARPPRR